MRGRNVKGSFEVCFLLTKPNLVGSGSATDQEGHCIDEERLTSSGLAGQHGKP